MKTKKVLFGTLTGTVTMFLLGFVLYGVALSGYMEANANMAIARPPDQMNFPLLILSNLMWALLISLIIDWSATTTPGAGLKVGAFTGFLAILGFDLTMHATTTIYNGPMLVVVDVIAFTVMTAITGAIVAWVMQKAGASKSAVA